MPTVLSPQEVDAAVVDKQLAWIRQEDVLVRVVRHDDFAGALAYVNRVGELAESANHHPDIDIRWDTVTLRLSTHSAGGITDLDIELAGSIDGLEA
jgi:4a-hydroxytetrahydrobiopterin dehydratase